MMQYKHYTNAYSQQYPFIWLVDEQNIAHQPERVSFKGGMLLPPDVFGAVHRDLHDFCRRFSLPYEQPLVERFIMDMMKFAILDILGSCDYDLYEPSTDGEWEDVRSTIFEEFQAILVGMDPRYIEEVIVEEYLSMATNRCSDLQFMDHFLSLGLEVPLSIVVEGDGYIYSVTTGYIDRVELVKGMVIYDYTIAVAA